MTENEPIGTEGASTPSTTEAKAAEARQEIGKSVV